MTIYLLVKFHLHLRRKNKNNIKKRIFWTRENCARNCVRICSQRSSHLSVTQQTLTVISILPSYLILWSMHYANCAEIANCFLVGQYGNTYEQYFNVNVEKLKPTPSTGIPNRMKHQVQSMSSSFVIRKILQICLKVP